MKLQNLAVIFIIIMLPIILMESYYLSLQIDTINMQTAYNTKLLNSTKEAISSFEINTVQWNSEFAQLGDSKRRDVLASINTFTTSFANNLGIPGSSKDEILAYVPAIAFTLYDGYYIYSPAQTPITIKNANGIDVVMSEKLKNDPLFKGSYEEENNGKLLYEYDSNTGGSLNGTYNGKSFTFNPDYAKKDYSHILKPFNSYSARYKNGNIDVTINYTLDNYITVYGKIGDENVNKSGYLISSTSNTVPDKISSDTIFNEELKEYVWYKGLQKPTEFTYVYDSNNTKVYFENVEKAFQIDSKGNRIDLSNNNDMVKFKKIVLSNDDGISYIYQALNGTEWGNYFEKPDISSNDISFNEYPAPNRDHSAQNYYRESKEFTKWVVDNLRGITIEDLETLDENDENNYGDENSQIFKINETNDPENPNSVFNIHKREVIKQSIITNLNQAITSYSRNSEGDFQLPVLLETDWDQLLTDVSIVAFVQGIPMGLKYFNNYAIATSTENNEYVNPNEIYINSEGEYHLPNCSKINNIERRI